MTPANLTEHDGALADAIVTAIRDAMCSCDDSWGDLHHRRCAWEESGETIQSAVREALGRATAP